MSFSFSTLPNNNENPIVKILKEQGNKVIETNGKTYVEFDDGEKYEVDLNKPIWIIMAEIDIMKQNKSKKAEIKEDMDNWASFHDKEYTRKTLKIKECNKNIANLQDLLKDVKNRIHNFFSDYNIEKPEEIENPYKRNEALELCAERDGYRRQISRNRNDVIWLGYSAVGDALKGGRFKMEALVAESTLA